MRSMRRSWGIALSFGILVGASGAHAADLELVNASLKGISHVYVARAGAGGWGRDLLAGDSPPVIAPGDRRVFSDLVPATYDLRLIDEDGIECEVEGIEVQHSIKVELGEIQLAECSTSN